MDIKKGDDKRSMWVELLRNGVAIQVSADDEVVFNATNGMSREMARHEEGYVVVFNKEDTAEPGTYVAEVVVTYAKDNRVETFPDNDKLIRFKVYDTI